MNDLISRKKVIDILEKEKSLRCGYDSDITIFSIEKGIRELPTAYSVDKVVEELEKLADKNYKAYCIAFNSDDRAEYDAYTNAIEIVKQGDVTDDACEWKSTSDGEFIQNPHTKRLYSNEPSMQNVYCNTCGKKIKIVGD